MATESKPKLTFNGKEISEADALVLLAAIYGQERAPRIIIGLADGTHRCASVVGGYLEIVKPS